MRDIDERIQAILQERRERLPRLQEDLERCRRLDGDISQLETAVRELRNHPKTPCEMRDSLSDYEVQDLRRTVAEIVGHLMVLEARFSRNTINIGVSGRARVGKSTLLQSISGLCDQQIPTGSGLPVTAVRSRIFHSAAHHRAALTLHTFDTFRDDVLRPYHSELGLMGVPSSVEEFRRWQYPPSEDALPEQSKGKHSSITMLRRLKEMQQSLWSYEADLVGGERVVGLEQLRQYVAYPTNEESGLAGKCPRRYLGVRDVRIECPFPYAQVNHVGIIDLPGLGELAANAEECHLAGLQNEVDVVLLVKRPVEGMAYWGREDGNTANLLDKARGCVKNRRDFVFIIVNTGGSDPNLTKPLLDDIARQVNDNEDGKHFRVLEADAANQESVYERVLSPVLQHLAERLPVMDEEVVQGAHAQYVVLSSQMRAVLKDLEEALATVNGKGTSTSEGLESRTDKLRKDVSVSLRKVVDGLRKQTQSSAEDPEYLLAVEDAHREIAEWIKDGLGKGKEAWCDDALRTMQVQNGPAGFATDEFNRIRVEISRRYCSIDVFFHSRAEALWNEVSSSLCPLLGDLLKGTQGEAALTRFADLLSDASEPCACLADAVRSLLALRLDYRTNLHPRVRRELDGLNYHTRDPQTGEHTSQPLGDIPISKGGSENLLRAITQLALQAAYLTKKALIREAVTPALILYAAAEQFEDALIRSGDSMRDFRRLARSYRDDMWPGVFRGIDEGNARVAKVLKAIQCVRNDVHGLDGGTR